MEEQSLSFHELNTLLDSYFSKNKDFSKGLATPPVNYTILSQSVISCIRLLCERMSFIEPFAVSEAVFNLRRACKSATTPDEFPAAIAVEVGAE